MSGAAMDVDLDYLVRDKDRHGTTRIYVRYRGKKRRLRQALGSVEFLTEYQTALAELQNPGLTPGRRPSPGTFEWLGHRYMSSTEFRRLNPRSQRTRITILEGCFNESRKPGSAERIGDCPLSAFGPAHVRTLRDRKATKPGAANNRLKYISSMFAWAAENNLSTVNPAGEVKPLEYATEGFHAWSQDEVEAFEARHPVGTKARLALGLLLFTGVRRGDAVALGRQHVRRGFLRFIPSKMRYKRADPIELPLLPELQEIIKASPTGPLTFLVTEYGKPFTPAGFGGWFRNRCDEAGLPHCTAHGLRKAGATIAAERGATDRQLMAIFGWTTSGQATTYTRAANQKRMAEQAIGLLSRSESVGQMAEKRRENTG